MNVFAPSSEVILNHHFGAASIPAITEQIADYEPKFKTVLQSDEDDVEQLLPS